MKMKNLVSLRLNLIVAGIGATAALLMSGCASTLTTTSNNPAPLSMGGTITGTVHGGQQPIYNAVVRLYSAGTSGYGTGSTLLATSLNTNTSGTFSFTKLGTTGGVINSALPTWQCPSSGNPQIYITAVGGNTQGTGVTTTNNAASALIAALGPCSAVTSSTQVSLNEISTAATVFALAQYINPGTTPGTEIIGTSSTTQGTTGLNNAVTSITNLASITNGTSVTSNSYNGTGTALGATVIATPESAKLITIADILASCINSVNNSSNNCADLFASAAPPPVASVTSQPSASFGTAQDTIQAAYYMAVNPVDAGTFTSCNAGGTTKLGCLFLLASSNPPFATSLGSAPTDWTIGVTYTTTGTCANGNALISGPNKAAVDVNGNIWINNIAGSTAGAASLIELSPLGAPLFCAGAQLNGRGVAIDQTGNVWAAFNNTLANVATAIMEVPLGNPSTTPVFWPSTVTPQALTVDGSGNVIFGSAGVTSPASGASFNEFPNPGTNTTPFASTQITSNMDGTTVAQVGYMAADSTGRIYAVTSTAALLFVAVPPVAGTTYTQAAPSLSEGSYGIAIDNSNYVYTGTTCCGTTGTTGNTYRQVEKITPGSGTAITYTGSQLYLGGINGGRSMTLDGADNMWYGFELPANAAEQYGIGEAYSSGGGTTATFTALSPGVTTTPANGCSTTVSPTAGCQAGGYVKNDFTITLDMAIDPSGNVWVLNSGTSSTTVPTNGVSVTEVVGAAVPVVTPLSVAVKNNTLATKP